MSPRDPIDRVHLFKPPYDKLHGDPPGPGVSPRVLRGCALIWWLEDAQNQEREFEVLRERPHGLPLLVLLPPPQQIAQTMPLLNFVPMLRPKAVLPGQTLGTPDRLKRVLAAPPRSISEAVGRYLRERGLLSDRRIRREVYRILELAPDITSVTRLARRLYTSRRTLGRHFAAAGLPVPSHWLQFARILYVTAQLQNNHSAVLRIAARNGYPDGFTLSNSMKRLIGARPTEVRELLGWEWIVEEWLRREADNGNLDRDRYQI